MRPALNSNGATRGPTMQASDFRAEARQHLSAARSLLQGPGEAAARYACLELRMTIEAMTYELFQLYLKELPRSATVHWQPGKVIRELLAADPHADQSRTIRIGRQDALGVPATAMTVAGEDRRFSLKWASKAHNSLGSALHTPTAAQRDKGGADGDAELRAKCAEVLATLDDLVTRPFFHFTGADYITAECDCGVTFKRRPAALQQNPVTECMGCGARYDYVAEHESGPHRLVLQAIGWTCPGCEAQLHVGLHQIDGRLEVTCACGEKFHLADQPVVHHLLPGPTDGEDDGDPKVAAGVVTPAPSPPGDAGPSRPPSGRD